MGSKNQVECIPLSSVQQAVAGTIIYPPGGRYGPRVQGDIQLVLLHTGSMDILVDQQLHTVPPGHVALLKPGHIEEFFFAKHQETWHRWISLTVNQMPERLKADLYRFPFYLPISQEMNRLTDLMLAIMQTVPFQHSQILCTLGVAAYQLYQMESLKQDVFRAKHSAVLMAISMMQNNFTEPLTLGDLAKSAHVTKEHLIRLFKRDEGITPTQYLWKLRIDHGLHLLRNTGLGIGEVSERAGFKTTYHFSRAIKERTRFTPSEIRKLSWGNQKP